MRAYMPPALLAVVTWGRAPERSPASIGTGRNACLALLLLRVRANATIRAVPRIYLDHNATTPLVPAALDELTAAARDVWGNASSVHHFGQQAKAVLDEARGQVAALLGADPPRSSSPPAAPKATTRRFAARPRPWSPPGGAIW